MTTDPPHADHLEILSALARSGIKRSNANLFTVLRDPTERVLSEYRYVFHTFCRDGKIRAWDYMLESCDSDLDKFVNSEQALSMVHNRQTKMLAGVGDFRWEELYLDESELLRAAKVNLERMAF